MLSRIIGFFDKREQAQRAEEDLSSAGYDTRIFEGKDEPGVWDSLKEWFGFADEDDRHLYQEAARRGATAVVVDIDPSRNQNETSAVQLMQRYAPIDLDGRARQWATEGWQAHGQTTGAKAAPARAEGQKTTIPVIEEQVQVGKRRVLGGGVRLYTNVTEKPIEKQVQLRDERVTVQRNRVDRPVTSTDQPFQERTIEVTETREEPVVNKQARVVEEVTVGKTAQERTQTVRDTARRTDVHVEKLSPEQSAVADQFAREVASDQRYRGRDWTSLEPELRKSFEQRYPQSNWDQCKADIRRGYEKVRQKV